MLEEAARAFPTRIATDFLGAVTTYDALARRVERAAGALAALGVERGDRVALVLPNSATHVVLFHAALRLGAVVVEHNPTYSAAELAHQLADSGAVVALVWEKAVARVLEVRDQTDLRTVVAVNLAADLPSVKRAALHLPVPPGPRDPRVDALPRPGRRAPLGPPGPPGQAAALGSPPPRARPTSRCCSTPAAPPARPRARC